MLSFSIANTVTDLIQGDVREHLPLESIPLEGDVLGLGTTTSLDNGELTFLHDGIEPRTRRTSALRAMAASGSSSQAMAAPISPMSASVAMPRPCATPWTRPAWQPAQDCRCSSGSGRRSPP